MKAYVQMDTKGQFNKEIACEGLRSMNVDVIPCSRYIVIDDLSADNIFYGGVGFIKSICEQYGYVYKPIGEVPEAMTAFAGRDMFECTLEEALKISETKKLFIKPTSENNKGFAGMVIGDKPTTSSYDPRTYLTEYYLKPTDKVIASTVVDFVSEWRCFVKNDVILSMVHYKGYKGIIANKVIAQQAVASWSEDSLSAYACDVGVTGDGETLVVECNDLPSLGLFGVKPIRFGAMLVTRWKEIHEKGELSY